MTFPFSKVSQMIEQGIAISREADASVRVAVYVDPTAAPGVISAVRDAFVPLSPAGIVRVARLEDGMAAPKPDTDLVLVLTGGSPLLESRVHDLVVHGIPVCVVSESSVEASFITSDTPILGLVCATDPGHLTEQLARWINERTSKQAAFAATFAFMRPVVSRDIIQQAAVTNLATALLFFMPGADFPLMTLTELDMMLKLAGSHGYGLQRDRLYEAAAVVLASIALKGAASLAGRSLPRLRLPLRLAIAGLGTYGMGRALEGAYERGIDYSDLDAGLRAVLARIRGGAGWKAAARQDGGLGDLA